LGLLLGQPLFIAAMICLAFPDLPRIYFLEVVAALWFGCSAAAQQIVKELPIYRRERMVNLRIDCYVFSKFIPLAGISLVQCAVMLIVTWVIRGVEGNVLALLIALWLTALNGIAIGLLISAFSSNSDKALAVVPLVLIPQIIFAGALNPIPNMNIPTQVISCVMVSRWSNQAMEVALLNDRKIDVELMKKDDYKRPMWNLYSRYDLGKEEGRQEFVVDKKDEVIRRGPTYVFDCVLLIVFGGVVIGATCMALLKKDPV
jgi:hypothetical protein